MQHVEREIIEPVVLCDNKGLLNPEAIGFARHPFIHSNLTRFHAEEEMELLVCIR